MRADMAKVLVERPRLGSGGGPAKGYRKRASRQLASEDGGPAREGMTKRSGGTKFFNEHLGPLRRYIDSQVGRPWDKVYAEVCARIDRGNVVQKHILTHLFEYVATDVVLIDGVPCRGSGYNVGRPLADSYSTHLWYVCPRSGLLRRARLPGRREVRRRWQAGYAPADGRPTTVVRVNDSLQCHRFAHGWELVTVAPLPATAYPHDAAKVDVILNKKAVTVSGDEARCVYGAAVYAVARRRLRKKELVQYPIPIDLIR